MLCERNDDVTYYTLFIACIAECEKVSHHELAVASMQRTLREQNSLAFRKRKSESVGDGATERAYSRPTSSMTEHLETQAKSFRPLPNYTDAASIQFCQMLH